MKAALAKIFISATAAAALLIAPHSGGVSHAAESTRENQLTFAENIKEHFFLGDELFQKKDYAGALIEYSNIRAIDPSYIEGYLFPAKCYLELGKDLEAAYFAAYTTYLDPENPEAKLVLDSAKSKGRAAGFENDALTYVLGPKETLADSVFRVYGSSLYLKAVVEHNGGKSDQKEGDKITLPLDFSIIEGVKKLKKFDGTTLKYDLESLKESIIEQKERNLGGDAAGLFNISGEYMKINRYTKALMAFEMACYHDSKYIEKADPSLISKSIEETKKYIDKDKKSANAYFYLAFCQFVQGNYGEALSNFSYSTSLGLGADYLSRSFKYTTLCKKHMKELEAKKIEKEAVLKASADSSASQKMVEVMKQTVGTPDAEAVDENDPNMVKKPAGQDEQSSTAVDPSTMTKEQKVYFCYQQRKKIEDGVMKYNENNIVEMNMETYSLQRLREQGHLKDDSKCPESGEFRMNHNGYIECSVHGL